MQRLVELYQIFSPSMKEEKMSKYVQRQLAQMGIKFKVDKKGQIYRIIKDTPMLAAHMDQVSDKPIKNVWYDKGFIYGDGNLGADDKNGIWIALKLLEEFKDISFIFSVEEECGLAIDEVLPVLDETAVKYCLVFDRRNGKDIIGTKNGYCTEEFEKDLAELGKDFGYKSASGIFSDCDAIAMYTSCVNLSCGYYKAHTPKEYTNVDELYNAYEFGRAILKNITKKYDEPEIFEYKWYHSKPTDSKYDWRDDKSWYLDDKDWEDEDWDEDDWFDKDTPPEDEDTGTDFYCPSCDFYWAEDEIDPKIQECPICKADLESWKVVY